MNDQELNDLLKEFDNPHHCYPQRLVDAIHLLVKQRDEARRRLCVLVDAYGDGTTFANEQGWDCFSQEDGK